MPDHDPTGDFSDFLPLMHDYISFSEPISEELSILDKAKHIKIGVDPNEYPLLFSENEGLVIATNSYLSLARYDPLNLCVLTHLLLKVQDIRVNLDVSNRNTERVNRIKELDFYKPRLKISHNTYGLTDDKNPFIGADLFFSHYKRKVIDVTVLKALMSGDPVIAPFSEYFTDVLSINNSILYIDEAGEFTSRPRNFGGDTAFKDARKVVYEFIQDKSKFDRTRIRQDIIKKGYTADLMVADLDCFYLEL